MQESIVFLVRVQCRRKESSRSLSHLLVSFCISCSGVVIFQPIRCRPNLFVFFLVSLLNFIIFTYILARCFCVTSLITHTTVKFLPPPMREATVIKSSSIMCMCVAFSIWQISQHYHFYTFPLTLFYCTCTPIGIPDSPDIRPSLRRYSLLLYAERDWPH